MQIKFSDYAELMPLKEMKQSPYQRNRHPKDQIEALAHIMKVHGVRHPISISRRTNTICFGHGRREAALLNGWAEYPVIYQDFDSKEEEYACVQSDNALAARSELDLESIQRDLKELPNIKIDLLGIKNFSAITSALVSNTQANAGSMYDDADMDSDSHDSEPRPEIEINEKELDENITTHNECPNCAYRW